MDIKAMTSIPDINAMTPETFADAFGDVAEHSPWVAEQAAAERPFASREDMIAAFANAVRQAPQEAQLALLRAHPDLAGKAKLTDDSAREQNRAGLDRLTAEEMADFTRLNAAYKATFGFPFIFAVKGADKEQILAAFTERIGNPREEELKAAIEQVCNILRFRIEDRISE
jgi:2-oxo-4-hydroxy-4-carboxy-5-ureidoimidazoline decarboxylase